MWPILPRGEQLLGTKFGPGRGQGRRPQGPASHSLRPAATRDWAHYKGLYRHEDGTVFSYTVGKCSVLDMPSVEVKDTTRFFCRTLNLQPTTAPLLMVVADVEGAKGKISDGIAILEKKDGITIAKVLGGPEGAVLDVLDGTRIVLKLPAVDNAAKIKLYLWSGPVDKQLTARVELAKLLNTDGPIDLAPLTRGGKSRWTEPVTTTGKRAEDKAAYVVDEITVPFNNPYKSYMRFGGFDFFSDGRAAVCTWSGDVWIVSGIDDKLDKLTWKRFLPPACLQPLPRPEDRQRRGAHAGCRTTG